MNRVGMLMVEKRRLLPLIIGLLQTLLCPEVAVSWNRHLGVCPVSGTRGQKDTPRGAAQTLRLSLCCGYRPRQPFPTILRTSRHSLVLAQGYIRL
ncbi:hypothetical protein EV401DRAFT_642755 [Pisolithus croceorrhizus]|nr:hypothetical protein EV401DRAFT_642755 [Pisolithus croceorrhizus]